MNQSKKLFLMLAVVVASVGGIFWSQAKVARADRTSGVYCVMDVVAGNEVYHKEFVLQEGETLFDDFSTRTRFKFFTASMQKNNGETTVAINWFADITVFNSVDFDTSVSLSDGQKSGKSTGRHTLYTSNGQTTTTYSLTCVEN